MKCGSDNNYRGMARTVRTLLFCALVMIGLAQSAKADTIYTYTGNPFNKFSAPQFACPPICNISGSFTLANGLGPDFGSPPFGFDTITPLSYDFTDGVNSFTESNSTILFFSIGTDINGIPDAWNIAFQESPSSPLLIIRTSFYPSFAEDATFIGQGAPSAAEIANSPGSWTVKSVPEPPAFLMFETGLLGLAAMVRLLKRPA
jgi:hypothetical protein